MKYYFIRHAESVGNVDKKAYYDFLDCEVPLTEKGHEQARKAGEILCSKLDHLGRVALYYTPFLRGVQTKNIIKETIHDNRNTFHGLGHEQECALLHERAWGSLREIIEDRHFDKKTHFNFFYRPANGGESLCDCYQRMATFFQMVKQDLDPYYNEVVIVAHGESILCGLKYLLGWSVDEFQSYKNPENCEIVIVEDGHLKTPLRKRGL